MQKSKHGMAKFSRRKNLGVGLKSKILRISRRFSFAVSNEIFCSRKNFFHLLFSLTDSPLPKYFGSYYQDTDARIGHVGQSRTCFLSSFSSIWTSCRFLVLQGLTTLLTENVRKCAKHELTDYCRNNTRDILFRYTEASLSNIISLK